MYDMTEQQHILHEMCCFKGMEENRYTSSRMRYAYKAHRMRGIENRDGELERR